jgi:hypothetical protein
LDELDLLASVLLEGGDDLRKRLVLPGVVPLLPPDHEVGGAGAEGCWQDQQSDEDNGAQHKPASIGPD